jgi:hypothetical protein
MMDKHFEAAGNMDDWPKNEAGKPTQAAVYGVFHPTRGRVTEILWTAQFPDLEPAMYWAAKKEVQAVRKDKWIIASRVLWQHELTPEQAVAACVKQMAPHLDSVIASWERGDDEPDFGDPAGPMQPVDHSKVQGHYVEVTKPGEDDAADPLASFFINNSGGVSGVGGSFAADFFKEFGKQLADDVPVQWLNQPAKDCDTDDNDDGLSDDDDFNPDDAPAKWVQRDPRQS